MDLDTLLEMTIVQLAGHLWRSPAAREVSLDKAKGGDSSRSNAGQSESDSDAIDLMNPGGPGTLSHPKHDGDGDDEPAGTQADTPSDLDALPASVALYRWTAEELYSLRERQARIMDQIMALLPDDQVAWKVARCIINGPTKRSEIAELLDMTETAVHATLRRLRRHLEPLLPEWKAP